MQKIIAFFGGLLITIGGWLGAVPPQNQNLGANGVVPQVAAYFQTVLSTSIGSSATTMTLASASTTNGGSLPSGYYGFTLDAQNAQIRETVEGYLSGTTVTQLQRGISPTNPDATSTAYAFPHNIGASVTITDYSFLGHVQQLLSGSDTFPGVLTYASSVTTSTLGINSQNIASVAYANGLSFAGAPNGNATTKGIYQEATTSTIASGTTVGTTGADLTLTQNTASTSANPYSVVETNASGTIDPSFVSSTANYKFNSLTSASTTLNGTTTEASAPIINAWGTNPSSTVTYGQIPVVTASYVVSTSSVATTTATYIATSTALTITSSSIYDIYINVAGTGGAFNTTSTIYLGGSQIEQCGTTSNNQMTGYLTYLHIDMNNSTTAESIYSISNSGVSCATTGSPTYGLNTLNLAATPYLNVKVQDGGAAAQTFTTTVTINTIP